MCSCVKLLIYSMYPIKLGKQDNQICSGLFWNTRGSCSQRERRGAERACVTKDGGHESVGGNCRERDRRDAELAGEARRRKPTREVFSSAPDRTIYGSRWCNLTGQFEVLISWEPHARSHARTNSLSRTLYCEVTNACVLIRGVRMVF